MGLGEAGLPPWTAQEEGDRQAALGFSLRKGSPMQLRPRESRRLRKEGREDYFPP